MKNIKVYEEFNAHTNKRTFTDIEIKDNQRLWDSLYTKYTTNTFFKKLFDQMRDKKYLSANQWKELEFLLKNGKSRYEAGILSKKY